MLNCLRQMDKTKRKRPIALGKWMVKISEVRKREAQVQSTIYAFIPSPLWDKRRKKTLTAKGEGPKQLRISEKRKAISGHKIDSRK